MTVTYIGVYPNYEVGELSMTLVINYSTTGTSSHETAVLLIKGQTDLRKNGPFLNSARMANDIL